MNKEFIYALSQIAHERDIPEEELIRDLEVALAAAYKKHVGATGDVTVKIDVKKGEMKAVCEKEVVGMVTNPHFQIGIEEARKIKPDAEIGDFIPTEISPEGFGRIAARTAKQVLRQKLREGERKRALNVFSERSGDVISGIVVRRDRGDVILLCDNTECLLKKEDQVRTEQYRVNDRLRVYVKGVEETPRGPRVRVSRKAEELVAKLFENEVPEIAQGTVEIYSVAREPGVRSKIAVISHDERVDAVGSCVGPRGERVRAVVNELHGEKVDIVPYSEKPEVFISHALSPAKVSSVRLIPEERRAIAIVPDTQYNVAIGKGGVNVRLAHKLTGWNIDIKMRSEVEGSKPKGA
jgi:N utilization substance protein A